MIIFGGKIYDGGMQDKLLAEMEPRLSCTLQHKLDVKKVIDAIDALGQEIAQGKYDDVFAKLPIDDPTRYKALAIAMLSRQNVEFKLKTELGGVDDYVTNPPQNLASIRVRRMPLGVLFHIAAGNADGLPAFSLVEGLLTGNINILKLPQADNGLSVQIISRLIQLEPTLAEYIYVFDTPSTDVAAMRKMADLADGICVWGGETAIAAVRNFAPVGAKLIEYGHKLSFCYLSDWQDTAKLQQLAQHIAVTKQLLCSSCQTVFLNTENMEDLREFCRAFLPILQEEVHKHQSQSVGERAHLTLLRHTEMLGEIVDGCAPVNQYKGVGCRLILGEDSELDLSPLMCAVPVKRLPKNRIVEVLRRKKGYLQTAGLVCREGEWAEFADIFASCGVTKVCSPQNMSEIFSGEAHDGEYPLNRYTRIVNEEV